MGAAAKPPGPVLATILEWRARRIRDPLARLRFLQQASVSPLPSWQRPRWLGGWRLTAALVACAYLFLPTGLSNRGGGRAGLRPRTDAAALTGMVSSQRVWPVEATSVYDLYSNGLRIENEYVVAGKPRATYPMFQVARARTDSEAEQPAMWRSEPAGIVFHSTESHLAPFDPSEVQALKRFGRYLLAYVRSQQSYHFVIDRFGRVYRIVAEETLANHAGKSIWSDTRGTYINLNASFLSVAFEAQTDAAVPLSSAQIHAARILTDMLRSKFDIPASNCVTHAQVSVNPSNMRIGYHTDWATGFPFTELGLPDNYRQVVPSMLLFGFDYDDGFRAASRQPWQGLIATERQIEEQAEAQHIALNAYRQRLQERYRRLSAHLRSSEEVQDESY